MMRLLIVLSIATVIACNGRLAPPITQVVGTWGGDNAGLIVADDRAHVHIGCTLGEASGPIHPDAEGRFETDGTYNIDAYPVDRGIVHPARFTGQIAGQRMILTVVLTDTTHQLGPVTLVYGKEPKMGPCPICRTPARDASGH
jgi:hypothetical protein